MGEVVAIEMSQKQQNIINAFEEYGKRLFNFIRSKVKNDEDAKDILQDVWYQLSSLIDISSIEQLGSYLYRVSINKIIDKKRKKTPLLLDDFTLENEEGDVISPQEFLAGEDSPEKEYENKYIHEVFLETLSKLPEKQRDVFIQNEIENFTLQEIADKTGENIKTIISRKRYAVIRLRKLLKNLDIEY
jgi:RNA polymerase sigma factor (sigma-70 family)